MAPKNPPSSSAPHFPWLDWCRFLGAFLVLVFHVRCFTLSNYGSIEPGYQNRLSGLFYLLTRFGSQGVLIFFVLSGFLVGGKALERFREGTFRPLDYSIDRVSRILVPFIPALCLTALISWKIGLNGVTPATFLGNLLFLQGVMVDSFPGNEPLWTLSYEAWFYVLMGACCALGPANRKSHVAFLIGFLTLVVFTRLAPVYLFCWAFGALAYICRPSKRTGFACFASVVLMIYGTIGIQLLSEAQTASVNQLLDRYSGLFVSIEVARLSFCAGFAVFIQQLVLIRPQSPSLRKLESAGTGLAAFSYTLYLTHNPILFVAKSLGVGHSNRLDIRYFITYSVVLGSAITISLISYYLFERRTADVRRWLRNFKRS